MKSHTIYTSLFVCVAFLFVGCGIAPQDIDSQSSSLSIQPSGEFNGPQAFNVPEFTKRLCLKVPPASTKEETKKQLLTVAKSLYPRKAQLLPVRKPMYQKKSEGLSVCVTVRMGGNPNFTLPNKNPRFLPNAIQPHLLPNFKQVRK